MMKKLKVAFELDSSPKEIGIERFEQLFDLTYFSALEFDHWANEQWMREKCARAHKKGHIGQLALWLGRLHSHAIESGEIKDLTIRWIDSSIGYGLFTNCPLKKWEFIGEYTGILRRRTLFIPNINDYCFMYPREWLSLKAFTIDSQKQGNFTRFINHSDRPNCESVSVFCGGIFHIIFRTIREISAGEELTYDYGSIYWNRRKKLPDRSLQELIDPEDFKRIN